MASSSQTGLMALPWDVLVLNAFLLVSTGKPNMSISTYVPTFLSDRNWPEMIWKVRTQEQIKKKTTIIEQKAVKIDNQTISNKHTPSQIVCWLLSHPLCSQWKDQSVYPAASWTQVLVYSHIFHCTHTCPGSAAWTNLWCKNRIEKNDIGGSITESITY